MDRKLHFLESFHARGSDGGTYKVLGYEHMVRDETFVDAQEHWEPTGIAEYRLESGQRLDLAPDGSLRVPDSGLTLTRQ